MKLKKRWRASFSGGLMSVVAGFSPFAVATPAGSEVCPLVTTVATAPQIDGALTEACWQQATWRSDFARPRIYQKRTGTQDKTSFAIVADAHNVYFAARCVEGNLAAAKALEAPRPWNGCCIEFFLSPTGTANDYYHVLVSPNCSAPVIEYRAEGGGIQPDPFAPAWQYATQWTDDGWTVEIALPLSAFYMTRNEHWSTVWRLNVARAYHNPYDLTSWSALEENFHEPKSFRKVSGFPQRATEDDIVVRSAFAQMTGKTSEGLVGTLKVAVFTALAGEYELTTSSGAKRVVSLKAGENEVDVPCVYAENGRSSTRLTLTNRATGSVYWREYPVIVDYRPVRVKFTHPSYRSNFYPGQDASRVAGSVELASDGARLTLEGPGFPTRTVEVKGRSGAFDFDTKGFAKGEAWLTVETGDLRERFRIRNLSPTGHVMTWVENGLFVVNGKPSVPRRIYGWKFSTSKAFDRRVDRESEALALTPENERRQVVLEPMRLVKGIEAREANRDVMPGRDLFDKIDALIDENRDKDFAYYYICDEPECRGISPVYLKHIYDHVADRDPYHVILTSSRAGRAYLDCADWFETHPYLNCGWNPDGSRRYGTHPRDIGGFLDAFGLWGRGDKGVGFLPTAFAYNTKSYENDFPTFEEYVCHVWAAMIRGAKSLWPYAGIHMGDRPGLYEGVKYAFRSVAALEDILCGGTRTVFVKNADAEGAWYRKGDETMLALVSYRNDRQDVRLPEGIGVLREFCGTRMVKGGETVTLEPFETLLATSKARDANLEPLVSVRARIVRDEFARTHRDNQLLERYDDVSRESNLSPSYANGIHLLIDGVRDNLAWRCSEHLDKPYLTVRTRNFTVAGRVVRVWGEDVPDFTVSVPAGEGWRALPTKACRHDGACGEVTLDEPFSGDALRLDFADKKSRAAKYFEIYEVELPK